MRAGGKAEPAHGHLQCALAGIVRLAELAQQLGGTWAFASLRCCWMRRAHSMLARISAEEAPCSSPRISL
ncbi:MAG TPA: hypothetical protein PLP04_00295 [Bryobacteraceae bacterium]|nr:hypothetical protein [Bryobacteraceae bacterium]HOQ45307.1 hypothetical protein [Bryobacteraceae bacterium]HPQ13628.1 hypothetical protein [Bryobacteraceae bacterium]